MSTASPAALDEFLRRYTTQVGAGFGLLQPDVQAVFSVLIIISLGLSGLLWALDEHQNVPAALIRKVLLIGFFAWLITGWQALTQTVINGFAALGLKAAGGALSVDDLMRSPSKVIIEGFDVAFKLMKFVGHLAAQGLGTGFFTHIDTILITTLAALGIIIAFAVLGIHIMVTVIEFYIVTLIGFVTVPFGILTQTAFLSERAIGYVVAIGVKVMALAIVVSIGEQIFSSYVVSAEPEWGESCGLLIAALAFCMLSFSIPGIAQAQITGGPQLSAGSAAAGAVGLAATAGGLALAGRSAMGGMAAGASAASSRGAAGLAASMRGGASGGAGAGDGGASSPSPGKVGDVAARAKASFRPPAGSDGQAPAPASEPAAARTSRGRGVGAAGATRPWRDDDQGRPAGSPDIHPPSDGTEPGEGR